MKRLILLSLMCLISASIYADIPTATVINETNCSCQDMMLTSCQWVPVSQGVVIQPEDQNFQPYGPQVAVGDQGRAPIFNGDFITVSQVPTGGLAAFQGAIAGNSYYTVMVTFPDSGFSMLSITDHNPC